MSTSSSPMDLRRSIAYATSEGKHVAALYGQLIAEKDRQLSTASLSSGPALTACRTAIHTGLLRAWLSPLISRYGMSDHVAGVALGGTGRGEMSPCSDIDVGYLVADPSAAAPLLREIERHTVHGNGFRDRCGFSFRGQILHVAQAEDLLALSFEQTTSLRDMRWIAGAVPLVAAVRASLREHLDPLAQHLRYEAQLRACLEASPPGGVHLKQLLRRCQAAMWLRGTAGFLPVRAVLRELDAETQAAYWLAHRVRGLCHLQCGDVAAGAGRRRDPDLVTASDLMAVAETLAAASDNAGGGSVRVLDQLLYAFERLDQFARQTLATARRPAPRAHGLPITLGADGLAYAGEIPTTTGEREAAALALLMGTQRYAQPIAPEEAQRHLAGLPAFEFVHASVCALLSNAGLDRVVAVADRNELLAPLFAGALAIGPSPAERQSTPACAALQAALRALDDYAIPGNNSAAQSAALLLPGPPPEVVSAAAQAAGSQGMAAVRLALVTACLLDAQALRNSVAALPTYFVQLAARGCCGTALTALAQRLLEHRTLLTTLAGEGTNDAGRVGALCAAAGDAITLHALFIFHCARAQGVATLHTAHVDPHAADATIDDAPWFNLVELYRKAVDAFAHAPSSAHHALRVAGFDAAESAMLADLGPDFFSGMYAEYLPRVGAAALRVVSGQRPARALLFHEQGQPLVAVVARNTRGLAAALIGTLVAAQMHIRQAHLFTATQAGFVLDFFHVAGAVEQDLIARLEAVGTAPEEMLCATPPSRPLGVEVTLLSELPGDGLRRLRLRLRQEEGAGDAVGAALFWLTSMLSTRFEADIHFVASRGSHEWRVGFRCPGVNDCIEFKQDL